MKRKKPILTLTGLIISIILISIWYSYYFSFDQRVNRILVSNITIDSIVINDLKTNEWTPVTVRVYDEGNFIPVPNSTIPEIYDQKAAYFKEIHERIIATLSQEDFNYRSSFMSSNAFYGYVSLTGLEKLVKNPQVREIVSSYVNISINDPVRISGGPIKWLRT